MIEILALSSFCFTLIFGLAVVYLLVRLHLVRRDLGRRIEQIEAQLTTFQQTGTRIVPSESPQSLITAPDPTLISVPGQPPPRQEMPSTRAPVAEPAGSATIQPPPVKPVRKPFTLPAPIAWFLERHLMVQVGVLILFIGVGFLLKYAADMGWLSLELRHVGAAVGGVALSAVGWGLRRRARTYGLALQGAGLGILYLTTFFAYGIYGLIPAGLAFPLLVALGAISAALAVLGDARILAFLAVIGAFLAPFLASTGEGSHVALFSYYAAVNVVILAIAWFKAWRSLNLAGFGFTLAAGIAWGASAYEPALFASIEPFLILFFLFYLVIALLFARRQIAGEPTRLDPVDVTLVFGNPLAALGLQIAVIGHVANGVAISALALGLLYSALALGLLRRMQLTLGPLIESFLFLGFFLLALSVPLSFDPQITAAVWAVAGAAWLWLGVRRGRIWNTAWGVLVQIGAGLAHLEARETLFDPAAMPFFSPLFWGAYLLGAAALFSAYCLRGAWPGEKAQLRPALATGLAVWGLAWWFGGGTDQILSTISEPYRISSLVAFSVLSAALGEWLGGRLAWRVLRLPLTYLLPVLMGLALLQLAETPHHFAGGGWYAWPLALIAHYWMLGRRAADPAVSTAWERFGHAGALWLAALLLGWFTEWSLERQNEGQPWATVGVLVVSGLLILLAGEWIDRLPPLFARQAQTYRTLGAGPLVIFTLVWLLLVRAGDSGQPGGLPFLPLLNPLDLAYLFIFAVLLRWLRRLPVANRTPLYLLWGTAAFLALNLAIARSTHHLTGVAFAPEPLFNSSLLQTTYAIIWSVLALGLMFWFTRRRVRVGWLFGAAILLLTILKLFLVDLANADTVARIVSFIGVGLLVIIIAYFAPAPPRSEPALAHPSETPLQEATTGVEKLA